jgi:hypothetical protein
MHGEWHEWQAIAVVRPFTLYFCPELGLFNLRHYACERFPKLIQL